MGERSMHVLVAGVTTRALAASAARAGHRVTAVDAFGDVDLREVAEVIALTRAGGGFTATAAARAAAGVLADVAAYTSNFENHPDAVEALARGRVLLGNPPDLLRRVRRPVALMRALASRGLPVPVTRASAPPARSPRRAWLLKRRRSGGGRGIVAWRGGPVGRGGYLQERIHGVPGSVIFVADGRRAAPLGVTRQIVGEAGLGARGFMYCGSLLGIGLFSHATELIRRAEALAGAVTAEYGLVGLNGIDFVARDGVPYPIEVNPRPCASMELVERLGGPRLFDLHERGCRGELPDVPPSSRRVAGKAIVFARRAVTAGHLPGRDDLADIPHPGERIRRGHPICTVFAEGRSGEECLRALLIRARRIYARLEPRARGAA